MKFKVLNIVFTKYTVTFCEIDFNNDGQHCFALDLIKINTNS